MEANLKKGGYGQMLTPARQNALYLGNIVSMIEEVSKSGKHEILTRDAKVWLQRHPADVPGEMQVRLHLYQKRICISMNSSIRHEQSNRGVVHVSGVALR